MMPWREVFLRLIRATIWPFFILFLIFYFSNDISQIIKRISKGKVGGLFEIELTIPRVSSTRKILEENPKIKTYKGEIKRIECREGYDGYFEWVQVFVNSGRLKIVAFDPEIDEFIDIEALENLNLIGGALGDEGRDGVSAPLAQIVSDERDMKKLNLTKGQRLRIYTKKPYQELERDEREVTLGLEPEKGLWNASCRRYDRIIIVDGKQQKLFDARYIFKERKIPGL